MRCRTSSPGCLATLVLAGLLLPASGVSAASVSTACRELDRTAAADCSFETRAAGHGLRGIWKLTTKLVLGRGNLDQVVAVEEQFCRLARQRGVQGRLVRVSLLPGHLEGGARHERSCAS